MDWLNNNWFVGIVTSVFGGLTVAWFLKLLSGVQPSFRNATKTHYLLPICISAAAIIFL